MAPPVRCVAFVCLIFAMPHALFPEEPMPDPALTWAAANRADLLHLEGEPWAVVHSTEPDFFWHRPAAVASLWKPILLLALQQAGVETEQATEICPPTDLNEPASQTCWNHDGHGRQGRVLALANSCNAWFAHRGQGVGREAIFSVATMLLPGGLSLPSPRTPAEGAALWCGGDPAFTARPGEVALALLYLGGGPELEWRVSSHRGSTSSDPVTNGFQLVPRARETSGSTAGRSMGRGVNLEALLRSVGPDIRKSMALTASHGTGRHTPCPRPVLLKTGTMDFADGSRRGWAFVAWPPSRPTGALLLSREGARGSDVWALTVNYLTLFIR